MDSNPIITRTIPVASCYKRGFARAHRPATGFCVDWAYADLGYKQKQPTHRCDRSWEGTVVHKDRRHEFHSGAQGDAV
jgi:hypothetical protein